VWRYDKFNFAFVNERQQHIEIVRPAAANNKNFLIIFKFLRHWNGFGTLKNRSHPIEARVSGLRYIFQSNGVKQRNRLVVLHIEMAEV
jgi:hypothetical protein